MSEKTKTLKHPALQRTWWVNLYPDGQITETLCSTQESAVNKCTHTGDKPDAVQVEVQIVPKPTDSLLYLPFRQERDQWEKEAKGWTGEAQKWEKLYDELQVALETEVRRDSHGLIETYPDCVARVIAERDQLRECATNLLALARCYDPKNTVEEWIKRDTLAAYEQLKGETT